VKPGWKKCPMCQAENEASATECAQCAVLFKDLGGGKQADERKKFPGHESNPNDPVCQSCGGTATVYPGVLRGGGKGFCSTCYRRMRAGGFDGVTEHGSQTLKDIREMLTSKLQELEQKRRRIA